MNTVFESVDHVTGRQGRYSISLYQRSTMNDERSTRGNGDSEHSDGGHVWAILPRAWSGSALVDAVMGCGSMSWFSFRISDGVVLVFSLESSVISESSEISIRDDSEPSLKLRTWTKNSPYWVRHGVVHRGSGLREETFINDQRLAINYQINTLITGRHGE